MAEIEFPPTKCDILFKGGPTAEESGAIFKEAIDKKNLNRSKSVGVQFPHGITPIQGGVMRVSHAIALTEAIFVATGLLYASTPEALRSTEVAFQERPSHLLYLRLGFLENPEVQRGLERASIRKMKEARNFHESFATASIPSMDYQKNFMAQHAEYSQRRKLAEIGPVTPNLPRPKYS